jgi:hypothetical protein
MAKMIPFSLVLLTVALPIYLAMKPNARKQLRLVHGIVATYIVIWAYLCMYVYTQHVFVE